METCREIFAASSRRSGGLWNPDWLEFDSSFWNTNSMRIVPNFAYMACSLSTWLTRQPNQPPRCNDFCAVAKTPSRGHLILQPTAGAILVWYPSAATSNQSMTGVTLWAPCLLRATRSPTYCAVRKSKKNPNTAVDYQKHLHTFRYFIFRMQTRSDLVTELQIIWKTKTRQAIHQFYIKKYHIN